MWWKAALVAVALAGGAFALGRASVDTDAARDEGRTAGAVAGLREGRRTGVREGREVGLREGRAAGVREGRALQQPAPARAAFRAGYAAGANDVFGGFDGGWDFGKPYVITLEHGPRGVTYAIDTRAKAP